jgi:hypothetical protein
LSDFEFIVIQAKQQQRIITLVSIIAFMQLIPLSGQWILVKNIGNYKVYLHEDWKENQSYSAEAVFQVPIDTLYQFLLDISNYTEWINYCTVAKLLDAKKDQHYIYYAFYDLPWPLANREAVTEIRISKTEDGIIKVSSLPAAVSFENHSRSILVNKYHESFILTPISEVAVKFQMQGSYHPGGFIPIWVIKKLLTEGPYDILVNIRRNIEK